MSEDAQTSEEDFLRWQAEWNAQEVLKMEAVMTSLSTRRRRQKLDRVSNILSNAFILAIGIGVLSKVGWTDPTGLLFLGVGAFALSWYLLQDRGLQVSLESARDHVSELRAREAAIVSRFERGKWLVFAITAMIFVWAAVMLTQDVALWRVGVALVSLVAPITIYFGAKRHAQDSRERLRNLELLIADTDS